jgi:hypothetical protein
MKQLLLTALTLALCASNMQAMDEDIALALLSMQGQEKVKSSKKSVISQHSYAKDCACAAKACCFACAACGLLTAPAMAAPVRAQQLWKRVPGDGILTIVKIEQTFFNGIDKTENSNLELPCFVNSRTKEFRCTGSVLEAFKFYENNWPTDDDYDDDISQVGVRKQKEKKH